MSVTGKNIRHMKHETGHTDIFKVKVNDLQRSFRFSNIRKDDQWKVNLIKELTDVKQGSICLENDENLLSKQDIEEIIIIMCPPVNKLFFDILTL